ncbi:hypothetical protein FJV76_28585 [Mesorhizobium sp. WSM4303]|nr:hypothetical protein FJV77_28930 [Mesorhizobium sp. WSM4306]TRC96333.1 hypothetical protein FJV76_28585 [Mesorhizobium sp. WSM4303]
MTLSPSICLKDNRLSPFAPPSALPAISPTRGEIAWSSPISLIPTAVTGDRSAGLLISPQVGEMSGRTEGGATERDVDHHHPDHFHELG